MAFDRKLPVRWHEEVPGSRWFRADLHVHTIDDRAGRQAKMPAGVQGDPSDPAVLCAYARAFLQGAVRAGVQVVGLTPHATKVGEGPETSAVWHIVNMWNEGDDDDGQPFREKVYAVFPGFEPNVNDGGSGVHLLFLFDPEIGRERYLSLFEAIMDGRAPWDGGKLRLTQRDAREVFDTLDQRRDDSRSTDGPWDYLALAPHFRGPHGLLREAKSQVLKAFPAHRLAAYELADQELLQAFNRDEKPGLYLLPFMEEHRQAFFHGSDAYGVPSGATPSAGEVGYRTTWVKLASPRIEAIRQAFIASESRLRIAYERNADFPLRPLPEPPDPLRGTRPWLRRVTVRGEAAFFGGPGDGGPSEVTVDLSPDLTCVIGGSMTGKSTLLDGLRVYVGADLPSDPRISEDVDARGRGRFLAGHPEVLLDTPTHVTGPLHERWPAVFFSQNELQRLTEDSGAEEDILARLVPDERKGLLDRRARLGELDGALAAHAKVLVRLLDERAEAEQQLALSREAGRALKAFEQAGLTTMQASERLHGTVSRTSKHAADVRKQIDAVGDALGEAAVEADTESSIRACLERLNEPVPGEGLEALHGRAAEAVERATAAVSRWATELGDIAETTRRAVAMDRQTVEKKLAEQGYGAEKLAEFQTLSRRAGTLTSYQAAFDEIRGKLEKAKDAFEGDLTERDKLVVEQRDAFSRVATAVKVKFGDRIRVRRIDHGRSEALERFLHSFRQKGITQWWNGLEPRHRPSPERVFGYLEVSRLDEIAVSDTVAQRFQEVFTEAKRYELRALRSPDRYVLELRVGEDEYRETDQLSGGKSVSLLLSLLLEADDERPLVIDQPEDQLDSRFLWDTVLPALRRLKGRRQVIVATHDADIVVNGDADLVVQLEADAEHGRVAVSGAIEEAAVRTAVIETVDGGERAFELRQAKYGF